MTRPVQDYFDDAAKMHGESIHTVGWYTSATQKLRFKQLSTIGDLSNCSVLDVGCGFGDLYTHLTKQYKSIEYHGIDISEKIIQIAKRKHPKLSFEHGDFESKSYQPNSVDYILASGAFTYIHPKPYRYIDMIMGKLMKIAVKGAAFNVLSNQTPEDLKEPNIFNYFDPAKVVELAFKHTPSVQLFTQYLLNDFTIHLLKA